MSFIRLKNGELITMGKCTDTRKYLPPSEISALLPLRYNNNTVEYRYTLDNDNYIIVKWNTPNTFQLNFYDKNDELITSLGVLGNYSSNDVSIVGFIEKNNGDIFLVINRTDRIQGTFASEKPVKAHLCDNNGNALTPTYTYTLYGNKLNDFVNGATTDDSNEGDGISGVGGGGGNFDNDSDSVGVPTLPSFNLLSSSAISVYNLNTSNLSNLSSFLFSDSFVDNIKKLFNNPIENILNLCIAPITNDVQVGGSNVIVKIGNVLATDTHADLVASQFYEIDLGTFDVDEHWGSCLDYEPYTRATLYLPYANSINLDIDKVMGCTIGVKYHCDIVTGNFIGFITSNEQVINMVNGNLKTDIALSGTDYTQKSIATLQTVTGLASTIGGVATGNAMLMGMGASNVASGVMSSKPNYTQTGSFTSASGLMGLQYAYIVFERVDQCLPSDYKAFNGYPSYITENLNNLSGFTKIADIHLSILGALDDEVAELESLLKEGVIL